jgi:hypothetical protein
MRTQRFSSQIGVHEMTNTNWAPTRIWLQREQGDHGSHTWCEDSVGDGDIIEEAEYVRVDARHVLVERGALQAVVNMLRRDEAEGRAVRGEMADELMCGVSPAVDALTLTDERIGELIDMTGGFWVDDEFRINGKDLMNLCRLLADRGSESTK